ncbi:hypothetical protein [Flavobacterium pallidum]|uniref:Uncharacterized protein n=1 Tax=Flavobacterium pallidum TaxID=2172098 RepID=A0A2S1SFX5_9FLAO|nr:hypothetical protein [Flavobacterium pallidum]AWI25279.1 hypothetical protein HYN49_04855 [Flavobacterium pallidum]
MKQLKRANARLYSGALQFAVLTGLVVALLLTALITLQNTHTFFINQSEASVENITLSNSGISFLLTQTKNITDTIQLPQLSGKNHKVQVHLSKWGIFEKASSKASHRKKNFMRVALLGTQITRQKRPALYLEDNLKPLIVVGHTILQGTIFLPGQGIKPGYIAGESFNGVQLFQGNSKTSAKELPDFRKNYRQDLTRMMNDVRYNQTNLSIETARTKIVNSFSLPTKTIYSKGEIALANTYMVGNIVIKSETSIIVKKNTVLKDVILMAPTIAIEDEVTGNFQAFSDHRITVGKNCTLAYPSALVLMEVPQKGRQLSDLGDHSILVDSGSTIAGTICYLKSAVGNDFKTQVYLNSDAVIKGEVFCEGNFEMRGKVHGSVFTEQFIVNEAGSVFINHIYGGEITALDFTDSFCGLPFKDNPKGIAKWLY